MSESPGNSKGSNARRACLNQSFRGRAHRTTRRENIVDEQHRSLVYQPRTRNCEGLLNRFRAIYLIHPRAMPLGVFDTRERMKIERDRELRGYYLCDQARLIESALALAHRMQRHRNHHIAGKRAAVYRKGLTDYSFESRAEVRMGFQEQNTCFERAPVQPAGSRSMKRKSVAPAAALPDRSSIKRQSAFRANSLIEKNRGDGRVSPALGAYSAVGEGFDHLPAKMTRLRPGYCNERVSYFRGNSFEHARPSVQA